MKPHPGRRCDCGRPAYKSLGASDVCCFRCWEIDNRKAKEERARHKKPHVDDLYQSRRIRFVATVYPFPTP